MYQISLFDSMLLQINTNSNVNKFKVHAQKSAQVSFGGFLTMGIFSRTYNSILLVSTHMVCERLSAMQELARL